MCRQRIIKRSPASKQERYTSFSFPFSGYWGSLLPSSLFCETDFCNRRDGERTSDLDTAETEEEREKREKFLLTFSFREVVVVAAASSLFSVSDF